MRIIIIAICILISNIKLFSQGESILNDSLCLINKKMLNYLFITSPVYIETDKILYKGDSILYKLELSQYNLAQKVINDSAYKCLEVYYLKPIKPIVSFGFIDSIFDYFTLNVDKRKYFYKKGITSNYEFITLLLNDNDSELNLNESSYPYTPFVKDINTYLLNANKDDSSILFYIPKIKYKFILIGGELFCIKDNKILKARDVINSKNYSIKELNYIFTHPRLLGNNKT